MSALCPPGAVTQWLCTDDTIKLRAMYWPQDAAAMVRGTVVILQGRTEYIEKYFETIGELRARGFAAAAFDWRGQGLSQRLLNDPHKGHVRDFSDYQLDLQAFMGQCVRRNLPPPYVLLAHSMGAHIAVHLLHAQPSQFDRAVLCSPMAYINTSPLPHLLARAIAISGAALGLGAAYVPGGGGYRPEREIFDRNVLTGDAGRFARNASLLRDNPALAIGSPTLGWLAAAYRSTARGLTAPFCGAIKTPCLLLYGDRERVSLPAFQALLGKRLGNCETVCVPGARHEILQETDEIRAQFWAAFDRFVSRPLH